MANVLLTGGSGYMGQALIPELLRRGHVVRALVRRGSESKLPGGANPVIGDALSADTVRNAVGHADVLVHLVGVAHPSPSKAREFREIDLKSIEATIAARPKCLVYVSVAHPAPAMKSYIGVRMKGEELIQEAGINATILRPWVRPRPRTLVARGLTADVLGHGMHSRHARERSPARSRNSETDDPGDRRRRRPPC